MADAPTTAHDPASNGHHKNGLNGNPADGSSTSSASSAGSAGAGLAGMATKALGALAGAVTSRIPVADLDERDPDYIREQLPGLWLLSSLYFRGEVRGLGNIPEEGPVLLVG